MGKSRRIAWTSSAEASALPCFWLAINFYLNLAVDHAHRVGLDRRDGRHARRTPRRYVKSGAVTGALDLLAVKLTLVERPTIMSADVIDAVERALDIAEREASPASLYHPNLARL